MSNMTQQVAQGAEHALSSLAQGWRELKDRAAGALTYFQSKPDQDEGGIWPPSPGRWGFMASDVREGKDDVVVRVEAPGMSRSNLQIELRGTTLFVRGEKRIEHESHGDGHYAIQISYGSFRRAVPLPIAVSADKASATYRNGVLRIVLPKAKGASVRRLAIEVNEGTVF